MEIIHSCKYIYGKGSTFVIEMSLNSLNSFKDMWPPPKKSQNDDSLSKLFLLISQWGTWLDSSQFDGNRLVCTGIRHLVVGVLHFLSSWESAPKRVEQKLSRNIIPVILSFKDILFNLTYTE